MALLAHWKCDENLAKDVTSVADSSGHANNHDFATVSYASSSAGFVNKSRHSSRASGDYHTAANKNADFLLTGDLTVMAWLRPIQDANNNKYIVACGGSGSSEVQADNMLWSLVWNTSDQFGMTWEQGAGVDVNAFSTTAPLALPGDGPVHIAVVRSINGALRDVKFYLNGIDLAEDVTGLTAPDGGANALCEMLRLPSVNSNVPGANIWNVRVYDSAEPPANVLSVYSAELTEATRDPGILLPTLQEIEVYGSAAYGQQATAIGQEQSGSGAYSFKHTGSNLDLDERPGSGWSTAGP